MHKGRCGLVKSHAIKSVNYPGGIDMGIDGNEECAGTSPSTFTFLLKYYLK